MRNCIRILCAATLLCAAAAASVRGGVAAQTSSGAAAPSRLQVQSYPFNFDGLAVVDLNTSVRFSWSNAHSVRGSAQSACRIVVSTMESVEQGVVWDSGKVASAASVLTAEDLAVQPSSLYHWTVMWWDTNGACARAGSCV
jgi:hypothetical protein